MRPWARGSESTRQEKQEPTNGAVAGFRNSVEDFDSCYGVQTVWLSVHKQIVRNLPDSEKTAEEERECTNEVHNTFVFHENGTKMVGSC
jgi:hypothetical protein